MPAIGQWRNEVTQFIRYEHEGRAQFVALECIVTVQEQEAGFCDVHLSDGMVMRLRPLTASSFRHAFDAAIEVKEMV